MNIKIRSISFGLETQQERKAPYKARLVNFLSGVSSILGLTNKSSGCVIRPAVLR